MLEGFFSKEPEKITPDPIAEMVKTLNQVPWGTRVDFTIPFTGIGDQKVTAYIKSRPYGYGAKMTIEGLTKEQQAFLQR